MSYILDALRRAESERERGSIPTLHAQALPPAARDMSVGPRRRPWLWGAALGLLLLGALATTWLMPGNRDAMAPTVAPAPAPAPAPARIALPAPAPAPLALMPPSPAPRAELTPQQPGPAATPRRAEPAAPVASTVVPAPQQVPADRPVPALAELPESLRRELPVLATSGAMYSETPANRMLIINGQVLREGDRVAANLVLEQIQLKRAVLSYKGQRFGINY